MRLLNTVFRTVVDKDGLNKKGGVFSRMIDVTGFGGITLAR